MSLDYRGAGPLLESTSASISVIPVEGQEDSDISFLVLGLKGCGVVVPPAGWTQLPSITNGVALPGLDTGSMGIVVYVRLGVTPIAPLQVSAVSGSSVVGKIITYTRDVGDFYQYVITTGFDSSHGANYSVTGTDNVTAVAGDRLIAITAVNTDAGTRSSPSIVATGLLMGGATVRVDDQSAVGNDSGLYVVESTVSSGTETGPPMFTFVNASPSSGATVFIRLRQATPTLVVEPLDMFSVSAGYQITASGLAGFGEYEIQRVDMVAGTGTDLVRGAARQSLAGKTTVSVTDYEFSFRSETGDETMLRWDLLLFLNGKLQGTLSSDPRSPVTDSENTLCYDPRFSPFSWVKSCTAPTLNQPISLGEFEGYDRAGRILGKHLVLGRSNPVVITDVLSGSEGTFTVVVDAESSWIGAESVVKYNKDLKLLFSTGGVYYFQTLDPFSAAVKDFYFTIETVSVRRQTKVVGVGRNPITIWSVKYIEVDRPTTVGVAATSRTWGTVLLEGPTWGTIRASNDIWLDVFLGE